jgi:hypothetical protein
VSFKPAEASRNRGHLFFSAVAESSGDSCPGLRARREIEMVIPLSGR